MGSSKLEIRAGAQSSSMKIIFISLLLTFVASQSPGLQEPPAGMITVSQLIPFILITEPPQVKGAVDGTTMADVAALLSSPVVWARETVTDLSTAALTMGTRAAGET